MASLKFATAFTLVLVSDQVSKWWATQQGLVSLNSGVSWGLLATAPREVMSALVVVTALLLAWWGRHGWLQQPWVSGLLWGGIVSNLLDRWWLGGVRDWWWVPGLNVYNNVADWAISLSLVGWIWLFWRERYNKS